MTAAPVQLDAALAAKFQRIALGHVTRIYPSSMMLRVGGPEDVGTPDRLTPIFYGSFDWHSCVHGYWTLARLRRLYPQSAELEEVAALFASSFTAQKVEGERSFLLRPGNAGFERPYGWGWLLKLAAEDDLTRLQPLADVIVERLHAYLPKLTYPVRSGVHSNTAFALILALDYAAATGDARLRDLIHERARAWFGADENCTAWGEPSGEDFLSASLCEALLMKRVLGDDFPQWFQRFMPRVPDVLNTPATVSDRSDGRIAHLDGLNLSRAWCWRGIGMNEAAASAHLAASLRHVAGDYMGEHWLASFALLALSEPANAV
ncbi:MAG: DUF2891 domain-containing protein [Micropepsaceae bacterium]